MGGYTEWREAMRCLRSENVTVDCSSSYFALGDQGLRDAIRFFEKGLFAPGQGILPRLTSGVYENRLVIGRGLGNGTPFPRLFNPTELVYVILTP